MTRLIVTAFAAAALIGAVPALASPCKDAKGKFVKCPEKKASSRCKDARGKFVKCGTPGAKPA